MTKPSVFAALIILILSEFGSAALVAQRNTFRATEPSTQQPSFPPLVSISLTRFGFVPGEITLHTRGFYLVISNYIGDKNLNFILESNGATLSAVKGEPARFKSRYLIELPPGKYLLREKKRTKWQCHLTIDR